MTETTITPERPLVVEETETKPGFVGQNVPRKEDRRLVQGQGVFFDDVKRHGMGYVHFVRSPYRSMAARFAPSKGSARTASSTRSSRPSATTTRSSAATARPEC